MIRSRVVERELDERGVARVRERGEIRVPDGSPNTSLSGRRRAFGWRRSPSTGSITSAAPWTLAAEVTWVTRSAEPDAVATKARRSGGIAASYQVTAAVREVTTPVGPVTAITTAVHARRVGLACRASCGDAATFTVTVPPGGNALPVPLTARCRSVTGAVDGDLVGRRGRGIVEEALQRRST